MEFIEPGFNRKKYLYLWSARNVLGDILSVSKPGDVKQLDARIQKPAVFNKRWWRLEEIREEGNDPGELRGAVSSARVGLPTPEGSLPRGASKGINSWGVAQVCRQPGRKKGISGEQVGGGTVPEGLLELRWMPLLFAGWGPENLYRWPRTGQCLGTNSLKPHHEAQHRAVLPHHGTQEKPLAASSTSRQRAPALTCSHIRPSCHPIYLH